jgi:hypothetical protein
MRYGSDIKWLIESLLPQGMRVAHTAGGDEGTVSVGAMGGELANIQQQDVGGKLGRRVAGRAQTAAERNLDRRAGGTATEAELAVADVTVCGSGNLAQVYFDLAPGKIPRRRLDAAYPRLLDGLVAHEGVGFVVAYEDDGTPICYGKGGERNLRTGEVTGADPLLPYAGDESPVSLRAAQVARLAEFPHSGDLILNSTVYPDGTVAAMEELIGNHGGLGGEQTDAFILHPADMQVPATANATDVYAVLNARRGLPAPPTGPTVASVHGLDAWSPAVLVGGLGQPQLWLGRALRAALLEAPAYREVAADALMTGPALLLAVVGALVASLAREGTLNVADFALRLVAFLAIVLAMFGAARLLKGRADFTTTLRTVGFAQTPFLVMLLTFVPPLAPLARIIAFGLSFFGVWIGVATAHALKGWRNVVLPVVALVVTVVTLFVIARLVAGAELTLTSLGQELGLLPR